LEKKLGRLEYLNIFQAIILGVVQGLTEFLPVSSSGHLVFVPQLFGFTNPGIAFDVLLHFATLLALLAYFWKDIIDLTLSFIIALVSSIKFFSFNPFFVNDSAKTALFIIIASIPTAIIGFWGEPFFEKLFDSISAVGFFLLITGLILYISEIVPKRNKSCGQMRWYYAVLIGIGQGLAIAPGLSRSGTTIGTAFFCGLERKFAARFSFLLAIPAIFGAALFKTGDIFSAGSVNNNFLQYLLGFVAAFVSGYLAIKYFLVLIQKISLKWFAYYCFAIGLFILFCKPFA
jgi:undecaprenyl-diphosphatase